MCAVFNCMLVSVDCFMVTLVGFMLSVNGFGGIFSNFPSSNESISYVLNDWRLTSYGVPSLRVSSVINYVLKYLVHSAKSASIEHTYVLALSD